MYTHKYKLGDIIRDKNNNYYLIMDVAYSIMSNNLIVIKYVIYSYCKNSFLYWNSIETDEAEELEYICNNKMLLNQIKDKFEQIRFIFDTNIKMIR